MSEIVEILYQWHQGKSIQGIERSFGTDRKTIRKYVRLGQAVGLRREESFPQESELAAKIRDMSSATVRETPARDRILPHREWIEELLKDAQIRAKQVWRLLEEVKGVRVGYCTVKRYLRAEFGYREPAVTVRMEVEPGSQAQVDFGYVGKMIEPENRRARKTWVFVMTLSYSRHRFVRFVFRPEIRTWIDCHRRAFEFFGGVPETVVIDNLKTGVIKPDLYDPTLNRAYGEMERHYGFTVDPTRIRTARHKGKVERVMPIVRQQLLAGRVFQDIQEANQRALTWCKDEVGLQIHGTTKRKPYEVFVREEPLSSRFFRVSLLNAPSGRTVKSIPIITLSFKSPTTRCRPATLVGRSGFEEIANWCASFWKGSSSRPTAGRRDPGPGVPIPWIILPGNWPIS
jgi:transposase